MALGTTISTSAVSQEIALSSNDVGELAQGIKTGSGLGSKINKWSKYKPVQLADPFPDRSGEWWRGVLGNCGLELLTYSQLSTMFSDLRPPINKTPFNYQYPVDPFPYRLADFQQYDKTASPPFSVSDLKPVYFVSNGPIGAYLDINIPSPTELTWGDIGDTYNLADMYFGAAICKRGSTDYGYITEATTVGAGGGAGVSIPTTGRLGMYDIIYFVSELRNTTFGSDSFANHFIPLPGGFKTVEIKTSPLFVDLMATQTGSTTNYTLTITNNSSSTVTLTSCYIVIGYGDYNGSSGLEPGESSFTVTYNSSTSGNIVVLANSVATITGSKLGSLPDYDPRGGVILFRNSNSLYNATGAFES